MLIASTKKMKLKSYFLFLQKTIGLCLLLCFCKSTYAQVVYTDIPDATPSATYPLDLNNDAIVDFVIQFGNGIICMPQNNNAYAGKLVSSNYLPWALPTATAICDTLSTWYGANKPGTMALGTSMGFWPGAVDKYLALKLVVGANTYYGWARFDVLASAGSFTIKDYAYESTANACIQTGVTNLGISQKIVMPSMTIAPNPFTNNTTIVLNQANEHATLRLYNVYGQLVKTFDNNFGHTITLSRDQLPSGLYFLYVSHENNTPTITQLIISD